MFDFKITQLYWVDKSDDNPLDLCAHGTVEITFNKYKIVEDVTVSAAGLYLLRSLKDGHINQSENLFPCCGFSMYPNQDNTEVIIIGCPQGINYDINIKDNNVIITDDNNHITTISYSLYKNTVYNFITDVEDFYKQSSPKITTPDSHDGFKSFWFEWNKLKTEIYGSDLLLILMIFLLNLCYN